MPRSAIACILLCFFRLRVEISRGTGIYDLYIVLKGYPLPCCILSERANLRIGPSFSGTERPKPRFLQEDLDVTFTERLARMERRPFCPVSRELGVNGPWTLVAVGTEGRTSSPECCAWGLSFWALLGVV